MREALFAGLARRLADAPEVELTLTFDELDEMAGGLPQAAWLFPHWWSNNAQGDGQSRAWLDAGFRVAAIEPQGFVTFVRVRDRLARLEVARSDGDAETATGTLELRGDAVEPDEGARWLVANRFYAALPDGSWPRRVRPADGAAFLVACWFSLRGPGVRGRLIDTAGRELTPEEGRALVDAFCGTGIIPESDRGLPGTDRSWSGVSPRAPDRTWDPDAAPNHDAALRYLAEKRARKTAGIPEPHPPPRPARPTGDSWRPGREMLHVVARGSRVFHDWHGQGSVLSVVPQARKTEALVRFDTGTESWCPVFFLLVEERAR
jgi:hypothetical protein